MKIPFDIKYRPQIESGKYRVETKAGCPVRIVCWDMACELPILGLVLLNDEKAEEMAVGFTNEGTNLLGEPLYDKLFIITPEEEMTEWQTLISGCLQKYGLLDCGAADRIAKGSATELLSLAREQFIKDDYVIEKKAFHDAVEKVSPEVMKEVSENVNKTNEELTEFERRFFEIIVEIVEEKNDECPHPLEYAKELFNLARKEIVKEIKEDLYTNKVNNAFGSKTTYVLQDAFNQLKSNALKDLPRWNESRGVYRDGWINDGFLYYKNHSIQLSSLEKLPGFKEDENHE